MEDIAEVGLRTLVDEHSHNTDHIITGPPALSYTETASILSTATGRLIRHISVPPDEFQASLITFGIPANFASMLTKMDESIKNGLEDWVTPTVEHVTGRPPRSLAEFAIALL